MWEHPYAECIYPVALVEELDMKQVQARLFPGCAGTTALVEVGWSQGEARARAQHEPGLLPRSAEGHHLGG